MHDYANLYFDARNPMMFYRKYHGGVKNICVLELSDRVMEIPDVVVTDRNAAAGETWVRFLEPHDLAELDFEKIYARDWKTPGHSQCFCSECTDRKSKKCAEVLVPKSVPFSRVENILVVNENVKRILSELFPSLNIVIDSDLFFC